jgi:hypothetical protein
MQDIPIDLSCTILVSPLPVLHCRCLSTSTPLASPSFACKTLHIPDPHLRHVCSLRLVDVSELIGILLKSIGAVDSVAEQDQTESAEDYDDDYDQVGEGIAVVAAEEDGHDVWHSESIFGCVLRGEEEDVCAASR